MRRHSPEPGADGKRRYGYRDSVAEDTTRCIVEVYRYHSSHQCTNARKPGTEFCGVHASAPEDRITMFYIGCGYQFRDAPKRGGIYTVEVAKLTDARVQLPNGNWDKLESRSGRYFVDLDAAVAHVRDSHVRTVDSYRRSLAEAEKSLAKFNVLYPEVSK